jgi:PII-like signaling protein
MDGMHLKLYVQEGQRVHGQLAWEWLLEQAHALGVPGGTAIRAVAGFGRHGRMHEQHFFELAGDVPVEVAFALDAAQAEKLLQTIAEQQLPLFYVQLPARFGVVGAPPGGAAPPPG